jgi:hypothetical protein
LVAAAAWFWAGFSTTRVGTFTLCCLVPTFTEPVWTSKAGAWPPLAVIPLPVAATSGAFAPGSG